jgi:Ca2+-binding EF-hand superfamily protein
MKAMFRIYYSPLETKFKLVFDMYDFDNDGIITKEDLHLVLSHIPLCVSLQDITSHIKSIEISKYRFLNY